MAPWGTHERRKSNEAFEGEERRRYTENGGNGGNGFLPFWVRAIAVVGIPGSIAIFLVWVGAQELPRINQQTRSALEETIRNRDLLREHVAQSESMYRMLQRICSNTARNDSERQKCFDR